MSILETVKIDRPEHRLGYVIINKSDFDSKTMRLYDGTKNIIAEDPIAEDIDRPKRGRPARPRSSP